MALVVEDGSLVANANSYVNRADYIAYAADYGVTILDAVAADVELLQAARYLDSMESEMKGMRTDRDQSMAWPRNGVTIEEWYWNGNEIPKQLRIAQMLVALDIHAGTDPDNPTLELPVVRNRVEGVVEQEFASPAGGFRLSKESKATRYINMLLSNGGGLSLIRA